MELCFPPVLISFLGAVAQSLPEFTELDLNLVSISL